jgi:adenosylhomocysteine nucleosidase
LARSGGISGCFYCAERVAVSVADKAGLRKSTGADAVEMESGIIRKVCRAAGIPSATVRVISDAANEDLPLDFNAVLTRDYRINYVRLGWTVATHPWKIPALLRFQKQTSGAAEKLARVLIGALGIKAA